MRIAFRTDASLDIGNGHVMRCLALAASMRREGADCRFITRAHPGHLAALIRSQGFEVALLPQTAAVTQQPAEQNPAAPAHAAWLGCAWQTDAAQSRHLLEAWVPDWLVLDHYALDARWESALRPYYGKLLVIDDLADRRHGCDLLVDQNFGRDSDDYAALTPAGCTVLCGPEYALLREEFASWRQQSLARRQLTTVQSLLITMGGVDKGNATGTALNALRQSTLPADCGITVVMGPNAPHLAAVRKQAHSLPWPVDVQVGVSDMARLMASSDLCIGAAGSTAWERCCLGLPSVLLVLAENQETAARRLRASRAMVTLAYKADPTDELRKTVDHIVKNADLLYEMSQQSRLITDGCGTSRVASAMQLAMSNH